MYRQAFIEARDELVAALEGSGSPALSTAPRRHTLELIVDRGGELVIAAPADTDDVSMAAFVREKKFWLHSKLAEKETRQQPASV